MDQWVTHLFQNAQALLDVSREELGGIILEITHVVAPGQQGFNLTQFLSPVKDRDDVAWPLALRTQVVRAIAEAFGWMESSGLIMPDPSQTHNVSMRIRTRLGSKLRDRSLVAQYRAAAILPADLVHPEILEKAHAAFIRGDHDVAVFSAFKAVEITVREACGYENGEIGVDLMRRAFNRDKGPLTDPGQQVGERQALQDLFVGAIGAAKNPASHRNVEMSKVEAARLIVFASYLMSIVEARANRD